MQLTATTTGSTSIRLTWDPALAPASKFQVYRGPDSTFAHAATLGAVQPVGTPWFNDYTAAPSTTYFYWIVDQNAVSVGPASATTIAATVVQDAMDQAQRLALYNWAYGVFNGLYPVMWDDQAAPQAMKPKINLKAMTIKMTGLDDSLENMGEALIGGRVATITCRASSSPQPPVRGLLNVLTVATGTYSLTVNGTVFSVALTSPANATAVINALQALLQDNSLASPPVVTGINTLQYGTAPAAQGLEIEMLDPTAPLTVTAVDARLSFSSFTPPKAMILAQRLLAGLGDEAQRAPLYAAGIGVGQRLQVQDLSSMLETEAEFVATFDFYVNLANVYPISGPIIDTVTAPTGTFTS